MNTTGMVLLSLPVIIGSAMNVGGVILLLRSTKENIHITCPVSIVIVFCKHFHCRMCRIKKNLVILNVK